MNPAASGWAGASPGWAGDTGEARPPWAAAGSRPWAPADVRQAEFALAAAAVLLRDGIERALQLDALDERAEALLGAAGRCLRHLHLEWSWLGGGGGPAAGAGVAPRAQADESPVVAPRAQAAATPVVAPRAQAAATPVVAPRAEAAKTPVSTDAVDEFAPPAAGPNGASATRSPGGAGNETVDEAPLEGGARSLSEVLGVIPPGPLRLTLSTPSLPRPVVSPPGQPSRPSRRAFRRR